MIEATVETAPFWLALAEGRLTARRCTSCGTVMPVPKRFCRCGSEDGEWIDLPATARIESFTEVQFAPPDRPYLPAPYTLGIVSFPAFGHRMLALLDPAEPPRIGAEARFSPFRNGDVVLPQFRAISSTLSAEHARG